MFSIGAFAAHGRVSVRMLRHYDAVGLLRPARVDPASGYRYYTADQLARLNRIIALKDLGFTLQQVRVILDEREPVSAEELRGMLRLREAELEASLAADAARLARVGARLRMIESEGRMSSGDDVVIKSLPAVRVAELTGLAERSEPDAIGPVIQPLYGELLERLETAGVALAGNGLAYYEETGAGEDGDGGDAVRVHAAVQIDPGTPPDVPGAFEVRDLPAVECAATLVHRGSMDEVMPSLQTLARWIEANGYRSAGYPRELQLSCEGGPDQWVTELQEPVVRARPGNG
ncbi:MerR family transcriptional regulator [Streptomyces boncukensis]|uniref:MerR family transcriptional regulator n=1 Tax=Streptomyces boncukensis TaxID=2711219 RepID=A0A6G4WZG2_9ACTN|nr:MerR family transcriptional regulator [Streptomyces boncukensis]NGO69997.1 MerR family transcriptional regulator [Streptomyces boncukensis]